MALPIFRVSSRGEKGRGQCVLAKKCTIPGGDSASWQKNALFPAGTMLPDEKTHYSQRGQCFLTKKRTIPGEDSASWQKNALSPSFHTP